MSDAFELVVHEMVENYAAEKPAVDFLSNLFWAECSNQADDKDRVCGLDCVIALLDRCLGVSSRDTNRAYYQAAQMVGVKYDRFHHIMKRVRIKGIRAAKEFASEFKFRVEPGSVYVAREKDGDRIKVGFSRSPATRIAYLQKVTGIIFGDDACVDGFPISETALHVRLRPAWLGGEWYSANAILKSLPSSRPSSPALTMAAPIPVRIHAADLPAGLDAPSISPAGNRETAI